jgi:hypothetical protein
MSNQYKESSRGFIAGWKDAQRSFPPAVTEAENANHPAYNTGYLQAYRLYKSSNYSERSRANGMYERAQQFLAQWEDQERRAAQYPNFGEMPGFGPAPIPGAPSIPVYEEQPYIPRRGPQRFPRPEPAPGSYGSDFPRPQPAPGSYGSNFPSGAPSIAPIRSFLKMRIPTSTEDSADLAEELLGMTAAELKERYGNTYEEFKKNVRPAMVKAMLYLHPDKPGASNSRITDLTKRLLAYINALFGGEKILGSARPSGHRKHVLCRMCGFEKR